MIETAPGGSVRAGVGPRSASRGVDRRTMGRLLLRVVTPIVSILGLWYLAIFLSGLPAFVIPRPERVAETLLADRSFITVHLVETLKAAALGFLLANVVGIGLAVLFVALPVGREIIMPAAITLRNMPYVALVTVLVLAFGDTLGSKVTIVVLAGFFPVLVNTYRGLLSADAVTLDRMRVLNASWLETFLHVRLPYALPYVISAQEITGSGSIIVAIAAEWMISSSGLGYIINRAMQQYRGDQVYAVAFLAAILSFGVYSVVHVVGERLNWRGSEGGGE
jgi:ABC-type nitrate/sulfonate/bicarbonate transport system permease component